MTTAMKMFEEIQAVGADEFEEIRGEIMAQVREGQSDLVEMLDDQAIRQIAMLALDLLPHGPQVSLYRRVLIDGDADARVEFCDALLTYVRKGESP